MKKENSNSDVPKFTVEQYDYLKRLFPRLVITKDTTHQEVMFNGGSEAVLLKVYENIGYRPARLRND